jgi:hypothetical protein
MKTGVSSGLIGPFWAAAQLSKAAVSRVSQPAKPQPVSRTQIYTRPADLEIHATTRH